MRLVYVVIDDLADKRLRPKLLTVWCWHTFLTKHTPDVVKRPTLNSDHVEDAPHDLHGLLVHLVAITSSVELEAEVGHRARQQLALLHLPQLAAPSSFGRFHSLVLSKLIENAVREFPLWAIVAPIVEGFQLATVLLELSPQEVVIGRFPSEAVSILGQHYRHPTGSHQIPHPVHARPLQAGPALPGVHNLLQDLVPLAVRVLPQGFHLLSEGVAASSLLVCGHAGIEDSPLGAGTISARHL